MPQENQLIYKPLTLKLLLQCDVLNLNSTRNKNQRTPATKLGKITHENAILVTAQNK